MDKDQVMVKFNQDETLINRCLRYLINNFDSIDLNRLKTLPRNLVSTLLKVISKRGYVTDENIHIFLNEQTRTLELSECHKLTDLGLNRISICRNLIKVDLNSNNTPRTLISADAVAHLACMCRSLRTILLRRCVNINDKCIDVIASSCQHLQSLNIGNCPQISDDSLTSLGRKCRFLKSINVSGTKITDRGIFDLMSVDVSKTIEEMHIAHCDQITDESIECILMHSKSIKYLLFHECPRTTNASRLALEDYMSNNSNQKFQHLTWTIY